MRLSELCACGRCGGREGRSDLDCFSEARTGPKMGNEEPLRAAERSKKKRTATLQKSVMSLYRRLRKHQRFAQKSSTLNPYTGRGLDKFALVTAEIAAKGETLAAQIGDRGSVVRFAARSTRKWIPFVVSLKRKSAPQERYSNLAPACTVTLDSSVPPEPSGEAAMCLDAAARAADSEDPSTTDANCEISETSLDEAPTNSAFSDKNRRWRKLGKTATVVAATVGGFSIGKIAAVGITMTVALTFGMLLNKRHSRNLPVLSADGTSSQKVHEQIECSSLTPTDYSRREEPTQASQAPVPMLLADSLQSEFAAMSDPPECSPRSMSPPLQKKASVALQKQASSPEFLQPISPSSEINPPVPDVAKGDLKQRPRSKSKFLRERMRTEERFTAPNSPLAPISADSISCSSSSTPNMKISHPSAAATLFRHDSSELCSKGWEEKQRRKLVSQDSRKHKSPYPVSSFPPAGHELGKTKSSLLGLSLTSLGIFIALAGLLSGHMLALICLVCWWYSLPKLRQLSGETSSLPVLSDPGQKDESIIISEGKLDLHSSEYKKRVIIEGLLERNRRSTF